MKRSRSSDPHSTTSSFTAGLGLRAGLMRSIINSTPPTPRKQRKVDGRFGSLGRGNAESVRLAGYVLWLDEQERLPHLAIARRLGLDPQFVYGVLVKGHYARTAVSTEPPAEVPHAVQE